MGDAGEKVILSGNEAMTIEVGSAVMTNVVMLGAHSASGGHPIQRETPLDAIKSRVPPTMVDKNVRAFESGERAFTEWNS